VTKRKDDVDLLRVPRDARLHATYYADLAEELARIAARSGAFDRALSTLPVFLFSFGIAVFAIGVILRLYEAAFGSAEFNDFSLFAAVFVAASAAIYVAEIRIQHGADRDKEVLEAAREALAGVGGAAGGPETPAPSAPANEPGDPSTQGNGERTR
jgi:hypothetical protein